MCWDSDAAASSTTIEKTTDEYKSVTSRKKNAKMKKEASSTQRRHPVMSRSFPDFFPGAGPSKPRIVARRWGDFDVKDPVAAVVIVHGLGEHSGRYTPFAQELVKRNIVVFSFDHRGHGRSDGVRMYADSLDELLADIDTYVSAVASNLPPSMPLFCYGHSMGGLLSGAYALTAPRPRLTGFVFSGPGLFCAVTVAQLIGLLQDSLPAKALLLS